MNQKYILETCTLPLEPGQAVPVNLVFSLEVTPAGEVYRMECGPYGSHELTGGGRTRAYKHWAGYVTNARIYAAEAARRRAWAAAGAAWQAHALMQCTGAVEVTYDDGRGNVETVRGEPGPEAK